jgi:hypothetical protein
VSNEKRIYVVVAETVDTPGMGTVVQVPGRMAAQGGHALGRMKMYRVAEAALKRKVRGIDDFYFLEKIANEKITTIWKSCRDSRELAHIALNWNRVLVGYYDFQDENDEVYGVGCHPTTAIASVPVDPDKVEGVSDYLPLWRPEEC